MTPHTRVDWDSHYIILDDDSPQELQGYSPDFTLGDRVLAMITKGDILQGEHYFVSVFSPTHSGLLGVSWLDPETNEYEAIRGWYDPAYFRRDNV